MNWACQAKAQDAQADKSWSMIVRILLTENCTADSFQCDNGRCIDNEDLCDGRNQCQDGSDEKAPCGNKFSSANESLFSLSLFSSKTQEPGQCTGKKTSAGPGR